MVFSLFWCDDLKDTRTPFQFTQFPLYRRKVRNPWFICQIVHTDAATLGNRIKYLLHCSREEYSNLFVDIHCPNDIFVASEDEREKENTAYRSFDRFTILDIQAYDNQIILAGESVGNPVYWPNGYKVWENIIDNDTSLWKSEDIILPAGISDELLGKYIQRTWMARMEIPWPPPSEIMSFWQQLKDI
jgi:hypothetical protein